MSSNGRHASVGEDGLTLMKDHNDSLRSAAGAAQGGDRHSTGSSIGDPRPFDRTSLNSLSLDGSYSNSHPHHVRNSSIGEVGTFQSSARARRMLNKGSSRRSLMRATNSRTQVSDGSIISERTSLKDTIPEDRPVKGEAQYDIAAALKDIVFGKAVSVCLLFIPFAIWAHFGGWGANYVFWLNFLVMIPLAAILGDFTEEAALHTNDSVGGLLNATFGNAVEVVVAIQALLANEIRVVQASMIGSIFSNLLLVLGCCFFFGGLRHKEQTFNATAGSANMGLLALSSIALVLPTPFAEYYQVQDEHVLIISRVAAFFLLFMYLQLLVFQLHTHKSIFEKTETQAEEKEEEEDDEEQASIPMSVALIGLCLTTLSVTMFSNFLVQSIDEFCQISGISRTFVGLIILPIVGNAVEHITAVTVAIKGKMDLAMGVAVGSCTQISLFVVPLTVLVGWATDKPMTLNFPHFEISLYVLSVFTVSICLSNGKSNWLEGSLLVTTYVMIAVGFWFEKVVDFR